jgi:hypothetical protein
MRGGIVDKQAPATAAKVLPWSAYPHWVLLSVTEEPESLASCWEEHNKMFASTIVRLNKKAVARIADWLQPDLSASVS